MIFSTEEGTWIDEAEAALISVFLKNCSSLKWHIPFCANTRFHLEDVNEYFTDLYEGQFRTAAFRRKLSQEALEKA